MIFYHNKVAFLLPIILPCVFMVYYTLVSHCHVCALYTVLCTEVLKKQDFFPVDE